MVVAHERAAGAPLLPRSGSLARTAWLPCARPRACVVCSPCICACWLVWAPRCPPLRPLLGATVALRRVGLLVCLGFPVSHVGPCPLTSRPPGPCLPVLGCPPAACGLRPGPCLRCAPWSPWPASPAWAVPPVLPLALPPALWPLRRHLLQPHVRLLSPAHWLTRRTWPGGTLVHGMEARGGKAGEVGIAARNGMSRPMEMRACALGLWSPRRLRPRTARTPTPRAGAAAPTTGAGRRASEPTLRPSPPARRAAAPSPRLRGHGPWPGVRVPPHRLRVPARPPRGALAGPAASLRGHSPWRAVGLPPPLRAWGPRRK